MKLGALPMFPATVQLSAPSNSNGTVDQLFTSISARSWAVGSEPPCRGNSVRPLGGVAIPYNGAAHVAFPLAVHVHFRHLVSTDVDVGEPVPSIGSHDFGDYESVEAYV